MAPSRQHITIDMRDPGLRDLDRDISFLLATSEELAAAGDPQELLLKGLDQFIEHFPVEAGRVYLMEGPQGPLVLAAHRNLDPAGLETVELGHGFTGRAARELLLLAQPVAELPEKERAEMLQAKGLEVAICVPLISSGELVGVLTLNARHSLAMDQRQVDFLALMAHRIAILARNLSLVEELREQANQIQEQKEALAYFAFTAFHDLKSPVVGLYGLTQRMVKKFGDRLGEDGQAYCHRILAAAGRIEGLVMELNHYVKASSTQLEMEELDLGELAAEVAGDFANRLEERGVKLVLPPDLPWVRGNRLGLLRVLQNLVSNSLQHAGPDLGRIEVTWRQEPGRVVIVVADDGAGIHSGDAERIFDPFFSRDPSSGENSGLGLAIVREVAERHHGEVWLEKGPLPGAAFAFSLPTAGAPSTQETDSPA